MTTQTASDIRKQRAQIRAHADSQPKKKSSSDPNAGATSTARSARATKES